MNDTTELVRSKVMEPEFKKPNGAEVKYVIPKNSVLLFKSGYRVCLYWDVTFRIEGKKDKEVSVPVIATHCPFCGAPFEKESA